ncbi:MAG: hypothetical protein WDO18_17785 [Acidobacteriota bacterium]
MIAAAVLGAGPAMAVDLEIQFDVLERLIGEQAFTAEGRRYVQGSKDQRCRYAYLEHPKLSAAGDRMQLKVGFSGKTALDMFGHCMGVGDSFELTISAKPVVDKSGEVGFEQFVVATPRDSFYIRRVRQALVETLNKNFKLDIMAQTKKLIEAPTQVGRFQQQIRDLKLGGVHVASGALVLAVDFKVIVK